MAQAQLLGDMRHAAIDVGNVAGRDDLRARILQQMAQLALDIERVDVDDDAPGLQRREVEHRVIDDVGQAERDAGALFTPSA